MAKYRTRYQMPYGQPLGKTPSSSKQLGMSLIGQHIGKAMYETDWADIDENRRQEQAQFDAELEDQMEAQRQERLYGYIDRNARRTQRRAHKFSQAAADAQAKREQAAAEAQAGREATAAAREEMTGKYGTQYAAQFLPEAENREMYSRLWNEVQTGERGFATEGARKKWDDLQAAWDDVSTNRTMSPEEKEEVKDQLRGQMRQALAASVRSRKAEDEAYAQSAQRAADLRDKYGLVDKGDGKFEPYEEPTPKEGKTDDEKQHEGFQRRAQGVEAVYNLAAQIAAGEGGEGKVKPEHIAQAQQILDPQGRLGPLSTPAGEEDRGIFGRAYDYASGFFGGGDGGGAAAPAPAIDPNSQAGVRAQRAAQAAVSPTGAGAAAIRRPGAPGTATPAMPGPSPTEIARARLDAAQAKAKANPGDAAAQQAWRDAYAAWEDTL